LSNADKEQLALFWFRSQLTDIDGILFVPRARAIDQKFLGEKSFLLSNEVSRVSFILSLQLCDLARFDDLMCIILYGNPDN